MKLYEALFPAILIILPGATMKTGNVSPPPATPRQPVTDVYHGISVSDDYRWLDDYNRPEVRAWSNAQNAYTRSIIDSIPSAAAVRARVADVLRDASPRWSHLVRRGRTLFALKSAPPKEQPFIVAMDSPDDAGAQRVVFDPDRIDPNGTTAIDFFVPSPDGRYVAVSLSQGGTEAGSVHVYETAGGRELPDVIPSVNRATAGGSLAWDKEGSGFYYTRYPHEGERPAADTDFYQQVYYHTLGTPPGADVYSLGQDLPRIAEIELDRSDDGAYILARVANGDGGEYAQYVKPAAGEWSQISTFADDIILARFGPANTLFLLSRHKAPNGKILSLRLDGPALPHAREIVKQGSASIVDILPTSSSLFVHEIVGGPSRVRVFDPDGRETGLVPMGRMSSVSELVDGGAEGMLLDLQTWVDPPAWYRYNAGKKLAKTALATTSSVDFRDIEVVREFAVSRNGTKIPLNILMRKGTQLDHKNPALLEGYGGFGISMVPEFQPSLAIWLEQGGVYAMANLRGGGEFGDAWHRAGMLGDKQNVFDDFFACARHLIDRGYTDTARLAMEGGSNGGLLMMAVVTQHPDICRAVVSHVGLYDMIRFERYPNGVFNTTEYGSAKNAAQFTSLYAYSPYHHVVAGTAYPGILLLSGTNDARVNPADSREMTARLQAATSSGLPILLRVSQSGHGIGSSLSERIGQVADVYTFLFDQLGVTYAPLP